MFPSLSVPETCQAAFGRDAVSPNPGAAFGTGARAIISGNVAFDGSHHHPTGRTEHSKW